MINLAGLKPEIERVCQALPVKRLGLFGSVLTKDFGPDSDVDILVVFEKDENIDFFEKYFELKEKLSKIFNRNIDLVVDKPFKNPVFREAVEKTRKIIYER
jgi:predicted nucleotidyltransferase